MNSDAFISAIGRLVARLTRLRGGHGSAFPGRVVEKLSPRFLERVLAQLSRGVVIISATNGKTTTTKMTTELLRAAGLKVLTNDSGSNFARGVTSAAIFQMKRGKLDADIAVVELDEAHAARFAHEICAPSYAGLLNVSPDQLDRFGDLDTIAGLLGEVAAEVTGTCVLNANDTRLTKLVDVVKDPPAWFGYADELRELFCGEQRSAHAQRSSGAMITLLAFADGRAAYEIDGQRYEIDLAAGGSYNALNGAAALSLARAILGSDFDAQRAVDALSRIQPAYGRGETFTVAGKRVHLNLCKNPVSFFMSINSSDASLPTLISVNNTEADGVDIGWYYEVDFSGFAGNVHMFTSGSCAREMAARLADDGIEGVQAETDIAASLKEFLACDADELQILAGYSAMLAIRELLK